MKLRLAQEKDYMQLTEMKYKQIHTGGINYIECLEGSDRWYWGSDYESGDLYEAEEMFRAGQTIHSNRVVFVSYPEGQVYEPLVAKEGQYLGRPAFEQGKVFCLLVDFMEQTIFIYKCTDDMKEAEVYVQLPLKVVKDCYNLMLVTSPLTLCRQGHENQFQVVWPEKGDFLIDDKESLVFRDNDKLIFSRWNEDSGYREEIVVRKYPTGELVENYEGTIVIMPNQQRWILC